MEKLNIIKQWFECLENNQFSILMHVAGIYVSIKIEKGKKTMTFEFLSKNSCLYWTCRRWHRSHDAHQSMKFITTQNKTTTYIYFKEKKTRAKRFKMLLCIACRTYEVYIIKLKPIDGLFSYGLFGGFVMSYNM